MTPIFLSMCAMACGLVFFATDEPVAASIQFAVFYLIAAANVMKGEKP